MPRGKKRRGVPEESYYFVSAAPDGCLKEERYDLSQNSTIGRKDENPLQNQHLSLGIPSCDLAVSTCQAKVCFDLKNSKVSIQATDRTQGCISVCRRSLSGPRMVMTNGMSTNIYVGDYLIIDAFRKHPQHIFQLKREKNVNSVGDIEDRASKDKVYVRKQKQIKTSRGGNTQGATLRKGDLASMIKSNPSKIQVEPKALISKKNLKTSKIDDEVDKEIPFQKPSRLTSSSSQSVLENNDEENSIEVDADEADIVPTYSREKYYTMKLGSICKYCGKNFGAFNGKTQKERDIWTHTYLCRKKRVRYLLKVLDSYKSHRVTAVEIPSQIANTMLRTLSGDVALFTVLSNEMVGIQKMVLNHVYTLKLLHLMLETRCDYQLEIIYAALIFMQTRFPAHRTPNSWQPLDFVWVEGILRGVVSKDRLILKSYLKALAFLVKIFRDEFVEKGLSVAEDVFPERRDKRLPGTIVCRTTILCQMLQCAKHLGLVECSRNFLTMGLEVWKAYSNIDLKALQLPLQQIGMWHEACLLVTQLVSLIADLFVCAYSKGEEQLQVLLKPIFEKNLNVKHHIRPFVNIIENKALRELMNSFCSPPKQQTFCRLQRSHSI